VWVPAFPTRCLTVRRTFPGSLTSQNPDRRRAARPAFFFSLVADKSGFLTLATASTVAIYPRAFSQLIISLSQNPNKPITLFAPAERIGDGLSGV